jgi:hypothetical protein
MLSQKSRAWNLTQPDGIRRSSNVTLAAVKLPAGFWIGCKNGGSEPDRFYITIKPLYLWILLTLKKFIRKFGARQMSGNNQKEGNYNIQALKITIYEPTMPFVLYTSSQYGD